MITKLASNITGALCALAVIEDEDQELYIYGFFVLLSHGIFFVISASFGIIFGTLWESIVFYIMFSILRRYAGGFHASRESTCTLCTTIALFMSSAGISILEKAGGIVLPLLMIVLGTVVISLLSPLDSEEKPLTQNECQYYRRKSLVTVWAIIVIALGAIVVNVLGLLCSAALCMVLESFLLVMGKAKKLRT